MTIWAKLGVPIARRQRLVEWPPRVRLQALVSLTVGFGLGMIAAFWSTAAFTAIGALGKARG